MLLGTQKINAQGHLEIGGCDTVALAREYGTPLYVVDEELIRQNCKDYVKAFAQHYPGEVEISYAGKAFLIGAIVRVIAQEGLALDVAAGGELYIAQQAGFPMEHILFHGNYKSDEEIAMGLDAGVGRFVVDNPHELRRLSAIAVAKNKKQAILLRVGPGIDPHTHRRIRTGQEDSKFGVNISDGTALTVVKEALSLPGIDFKGIHCHVGSQLLDMESHKDAIDVMVEFLAKIRSETGITASGCVTLMSTSPPPTMNSPPPCANRFLRRLRSIRSLRLSSCKSRVAPSWRRREPRSTPSGRKSASTSSRHRDTVSMPSWMGV
jgi:diaminopimelate decarboxylase